jgi:hypothetical protein
MLAIKTTILIGVVFFFSLFAGEAAAQKKFSRSYPTGRAVRLTLVNKTGTVDVIGWDRPEINITAKMDSPAASITPQNLSGEIVINVARENEQRDVGPVNFTIRVPYYASVDIETRIGNLSVSNVRSNLVRAHISSDGDITLTNIGSNNVVAENLTGDILYDGELQPRGTYRFNSMRGSITIRIPFTSSFTLRATAPSTRKISLGAFVSPDMSIIGDGRRIVGRYGDGAAAIDVTNQKGSISFLRR